MAPSPSTDRRRHRRQPLSAGVQFHHGPSSRDFPGRCVDVSDNGMLLYVPAATPVQAGQAIRLRIGGTEQSDQPVQATIVRVDRHRLLSMGYVAVGIEFASGQ